MSERIEEMTLDQFAEAVKPRTITGYLIDVQNETHGPRTIEKPCAATMKSSVAA